MKDLLSNCKYLNCKIKYTPEGQFLEVLGDFSIHNQIVSVLDIPLLMFFPKDVFILQREKEHACMQREEQR